LDVRASRTKKEGEAKEHPERRNGKEYRGSINEQFPLIRVKSFPKGLPLLYGKELGSRLSSKSYMLKRETL